MMQLSGGKAGFSLIELVMAITVLGIALTVLSNGLQTASERAVAPLFAVQASWIARSYLDEIESRTAESQLQWCYAETPIAHSSGARAQFESLCDYQSQQPQSVKTYQGKPIDFLKDYRIQVDVEWAAVDAQQSVGFALSGEQYGREPEGVRIIATVTHPAIGAVVMESWVWAI